MIRTLPRRSSGKTRPQIDQPLLKSIDGIAEGERNKPDFDSRPASGLSDDVYRESFHALIRVDEVVGRSMIDSDPVHPIRVKPWPFQRIGCEEYKTKAGDSGGRHAEPSPFLLKSLHLI